MDGLEKKPSGLSLSTTSSAVQPNPKMDAAIIDRMIAGQLEDGIDLERQAICREILGLEKEIAVTELQVRDGSVDMERTTKPVASSTVQGEKGL